ncbi:MAG: non-canonical purine NTP pyrophosphatase [Thermoanaerobaculum sp.]|nr:non-canonical purine NTP pyrophosphatase [Thermoanaerobaculum sp.]
MILTFVTSSEEKFQEAQAILALPLQRVDLDLPEVQGLDVEVLAEEKARTAFAQLQRPVIVEDTSLELEALGGFPGPLVKWLLKAAGPQALPQMLQGFATRAAVARTAAVAFDGVRLIRGVGKVRGIIVPQPRGSGGFGWDVGFAPEGGDGRTYAEMSPQEKNRISHRAHALRALRHALEEEGWTLR